MAKSEDNMREIIEFILKSINKSVTMQDSELKVLLHAKYSTSDEKRFEAVELIHRSQIISVKPLNDGDLLYTLTSQTKSVANFATGEENQVYQEILKAGAAGISKLELKNKVKLGVKVIAKVLKNLEHEGHVAQHKTKERNRVVYMDANVVPEENIVGGNLYVNGEVDKDFLDALNRNLVKFIEDRKVAGYSEVLAFLSSTQEGQSLDEKEIQLVINCLILDKIIRKEGNKFCLTKRSTLFQPIENQIPCFGCPMFEGCRIGAYVSPSTCVYFNDW